MITVPSRELKNRLGKYLRLVREGEEVQITDRGEPVAFIVPLDAQARPGVDEVRRVFSKGSVVLGSGRLSRSRPGELSPGPSASEMIVEDRR